MLDTKTDASELEEAVAVLYDRSAWVDMDRIHGIFARMRKEDPVHFSQQEGFPDFWHITKHADIFEIESKSDIFLNEPRGLILETVREEAVKQVTGGSTQLIRSLVSIDKPDHPKMRLLAQSWFMPKNLKNLDSAINDIAKASIDRLQEAGPTCDFASGVAVWYPLRVIMSVLGVPPEDEPRMLKLTQELFGSHDPDMKRKNISRESKSPIAAIVETFVDFQNYFRQITESRRANPTDDIASVIANATIDGKPLNERDTMGYYIIIATAGHDTTSYSSVEVMHQLAKSPELFARMKADPDNVIPNLVEEAIRFTSPVRHFCRTAAEDHEFRGKLIKKGESLVLWYPSGSRDEDVFNDPDTFDIDRDLKSVRHAAFGHGAHMCLGMYLARQELTALFKELAARAKSISLADEPKYAHANYVGGIKSLPINIEFE